ncbi:MAG: RNA polymerase sigma factor [Planctomycetota bacterium]|jgi:RNA polymerase sigma-70 factor (ECF subfamily)
MAAELNAEFEKLWRGTSPKVRAYMFCACGTWPDADDLVQDCYFRALRGWSQFSGKASRQAWLFAIARRTRADWFRRKKRQAKVVALVDSNGPVEEVCESNEDRLDSIWQSLEALDNEQSEVIQLKFAGNLSYAEIAQTLGIPIGTVRSRLHRGLKAVRKEIEGQRDEP